MGNLRTASTGIHWPQNTVICVQTEDKFKGGKNTQENAFIHHVLCSVDKSQRYFRNLFESYTCVTKDVFKLHHLYTGGSVRPFNGYIYRRLRETQRKLPHTVQKWTHFHEFLQTEQYEL